MAITLTPELAGWTQPNATTLRSPNGDFEIGDSAQTSFFPQFKQIEHGGQVTFSLRLSLPDFVADRLVTEGNEVVYEKGSISCRFKFETGRPQTVTIGGVEYHYNTTDRFGFRIDLGARPPRNTLDFTIGGNNISLHLQPPLTTQEITDGAVREDHVVNSIAIKNTAGLKDQYGSNKIGHLYRPRATGANGAGVWCDWSIVNATTIRLTCSQQFLNTAVYPVVVE